MTVNQAAAELQCSISFIYKLMTQGQLAYERRGRRKLPVAESVAEYRHRNLVPATTRVSRPSPNVKGYQFKYLFRD
jgi:excisionase family DNA binding protein